MFYQSQLQVSRALFRWSRALKCEPSGQSYHNGYFQRHNSSMLTLGQHFLAVSGSFIHRVIRRAHLSPRGSTRSGTKAKKAHLGHVETWLVPVIGSFPFRKKGSLHCCKAWWECFKSTFENEGESGRFPRRRMQRCHARIKTCVSWDHSYSENTCFLDWVIKPFWKFVQ